MKPIQVRRQLVVEVPDDVDVILLERATNEQAWLGRGAAMTARAGVDTIAPRND